MTEAANPGTGIAPADAFAGTDIAASGETSAIAAAEQAKALVQAKFVMALQCTPSPSAEGKSKALAFAS